MKFNHPLYYCCECKTILDSLDKLLFVEENSTKGFCSEACIEDFYTPLIRHFENIELKIRKKLNIVDEKINMSMSDIQLVDDVLLSPGEVWKASNELDEDIFTYIKRYTDYSGIVICKVYNGEASFVFFSTTTNSPDFISEFRTGEKINKSELSHDNEEYPEEFSEEDFNFMQLLENKKSKLSPAFHELFFKASIK